MYIPSASILLFTGFVTQVFGFDQSILCVDNTTDPCNDEILLCHGSTNCSIECFGNYACQSSTISGYYARSLYANAHGRGAAVSQHFILPTTITTVSKILIQSPKYQEQFSTVLVVLHVSIVNGIWIIRILWQLNVKIGIHVTIAILL